MAPRMRDRLALGMGDRLPPGFATAWLSGCVNVWASERATGCCLARTPAGRVTVLSGWSLYVLALDAAVSLALNKAWAAGCGCPLAVATSWRLILQ